MHVRIAGLNGSLEHQTYLAPDDGINQFTDCDLWIVISDRLSFPLLTCSTLSAHGLRLSAAVSNSVDDDTNQQFVARAHAAEAVMVTTAFTAGDARQFAGIPAKKIKRVPILAPEFLSRPKILLALKAILTPFFHLDDQSCPPQKS